MQSVQSCHSPVSVWLYRRALGCLLAAIFFVGTVAAFQQTASAKECEEGRCPAVKIVNCTKMEYKIRFAVCCDGVVKETDYYLVPTGECPDAVVKFDFSPCTIIKYGFSQPLPRCIRTYWDESNCYLYIYNICNTTD